MRVTTKGQVTIPQEIREQHGFWPHTEVEFVAVGDKIVLQKAKGATSRGDRLVQRLRGAGTGTMSTDEIMALTRGEQ